MSYLEKLNKSTLNTPDKYGNTALMYAVINNKYDICKLLIEKGANVNLKDNNKKTALYYALVDKKYDLAKILIENNAIVSVEDRIKINESGNQNLIKTSKKVINNLPKLTINDIKKILSMNITNEKLSKINSYYKNNPNKESIIPTIKNRLIELINYIIRIDFNSMFYDTINDRLKQLILINNFMKKQNIILDDDFKEKLKGLDKIYVTCQSPEYSQNLTKNEWNKLYNNYENQCEEERKIINTKKPNEIIEDFIKLCNNKNNLRKKFSIKLTNR